MPDFETLFLRLSLTILIGGLIGAEREYRSKFAGLRTMLLISLGSFLFTTLSIYLTQSDRIASNIVTGIGFIGGGVIFKSDTRVNGITTAATIWVVAALGMGVAMGAYQAVAASTILIMIILLFLNKIEDYIDSVNQTHTYRISSVYKEDLLKEYEELMKQNGLRYKRINRTKIRDNIVGTWTVNGPEKSHNKFTKMILHHESVKEFEF